ADLAGEGLAAALSDVRVDLVSHHAAQIDVRVSVADPVRDARVNLVGLLNLLEVLRAEDLPPLVFASSGGVMYGEAEVIPTPEGAPKQLFSPYGVAKLASEYYLQYYARVYGLRYAALRYSNVYGPRQNPEGEAGVVAIFSGKALRDEPLTVYGTGEQDRDFVYVGDVAEANWLASRALTGGAPSPAPEPESAGGPAARTSEEPVDEPAFNVATGQATTVLELAQAFGRLAGRELEVRRAPPRSGELLHSTLDCSKAASRLGWSARTPLHEGLDATYRFFQRARTGQHARGTDA
ncbi:MAG: NAD-dependent epimerase/dehydratase family protein, partial [Gemmatimonadota bacterium]